MEQRIIMKRIDQILSHPVFQEQFALLQEAEKDRIFCRHTMEHFLDVARLMYIYNLEDQAGFSKEMIYAAGLLLVGSEMCIRDSSSPSGRGKTGGTHPYGL